MTFGKTLGLALLVSGGMAVLAASFTDASEPGLLGMGVLLLVAGGVTMAASSSRPPTRPTVAPMAPAFPLSSPTAAPPPALPAYQVCASCGRPREGNARYCTGCGRTWDAPACASCGKPFAPGNRYCTGCGAPQA